MPLESKISTPSGIEPIPDRSFGIRAFGHAQETLVSRMVFTVFRIDASPMEDEDDFYPESFPSVELGQEPLEFAKQMGANFEGKASPRAIETSEGFVYDVHDVPTIVRGLETLLSDLEDSPNAVLLARVLEVFQEAHNYRLPCLLRV